MSIQFSLSQYSLKNRLLLFGGIFLLLPISWASASEQQSDENLLKPVCPKAELPTTRRRPGENPRLKFEVPACNTEALPPIQADAQKDPIPVPDRWRIVEALGYPDNWLDPYNSNNPLKGDRPVWGKDWFFNLNASSISQFEARSRPIAGQSDANSLNAPITSGDQTVFQQSVILDTIAYKGDTVFRPPDYLFRFTPVVNYNQTRGAGKSITQGHFAVQSLYFEKHLWNVSEHYDFDSIRVGIQPFTSDFRGFLFRANPVGIRLFGTRSNNTLQYNLAWFRPLRRNVNNGLNDLSQGIADNDIIIANLYWQDLFTLGFNSQFSVIYNHNREARTALIDNNLSRDHDYDVAYLGYNGDGHFGRLNTSFSMYYAVGEESTGTFVDSNNSVRAFFAALELSMDFDWVRVRLSGLHASGDDDPFDNKAEGFAAISQNPMLFAGSDSSYFSHQSLPLLAGSVNLTRRNSLFNSMNSADDPGQSNFTNPGLNLLGIGADFDLTPELRISFNANQLWFDETAPLQALLGKSSIARNIGQDLSITTLYRPFATQNVIFRLSAAALVPGQGYRDIYNDSRINYSVQTFLILNY